MNPFSILISFAVAFTHSALIKTIEYNQKKHTLDFNINLFIRSSFTSFGYIWVSITLFAMLNDLIMFRSNLANETVANLTNIAGYVIPLFLDYISKILAKKIIFDDQITKNSRRMLTPEVKQAYLFWILTGTSIGLYTLAIAIILFFNIQ